MAAMDCGENASRPWPLPTCRPIRPETPWRRKPRSTESPSRNGLGTSACSVGAAMAAMDCGESASRPWPLPHAGLSGPETPWRRKPKSTESPSRSGPEQPLAPVGAAMARWTAVKTHRGHGRSQTQAASKPKAPRSPFARCANGRICRRRRPFAHRHGSSARAWTVRPTTGTVVHAIAPLVTTPLCAPRVGVKAAGKDIGGV